MIKASEFFDQCLNFEGWKCLNCGYIHEGIEAPKVCPVCKHPQAYFEVHTENY